MRFSIVIDACRESGLLAKTIESCTRSAGIAESSYEIVVAGDVSDDDSLGATVRQFPQVRVVNSTAGQDMSSTKRLGAQNAQGDVLIFLTGPSNPDASALLRLMEDVEQLDGNAIATPAIATLDTEQWENSPKQVGHGYRPSLETFECDWLPLDEMRLIEGRRNLYESPALNGCAFAVGRQLYHDLGGFDGNMLVRSLEDLDFGLRCWMLGHAILHDPEAVVGQCFGLAPHDNDVPFERLLASQLRLVRKVFTNGVCHDWIERCRRRIAALQSEHAEVVWDRACGLFNRRLATADAERAQFHARRVCDEFRYAERFGLPWPRARPLRLSRRSARPEPDTARQPVQASPGSPAPGMANPIPPRLKELRERSAYGDANARGKSTVVRQNRVIFDGTYHYQYDAEGNRTVKYRSATGALDTEAFDITTYRWHNGIRLCGFAHKRTYGAEPDEAIARDCGPSDRAQAESAAVVGCQVESPTERSQGRIAFISPYCLIDFSNGAATATRDGLKLLAEQGFECTGYCAARLDETGEALIQEQLIRRKIEYEVRKSKIGQYNARLIALAEGNVRVTLFENGSTSGGWVGADEVKGFLGGCEVFLRQNMPKVVVTYGCDPVSIAIQQLAKRKGATLVFWLHNFGYTHRAAFALADYIVVPSEFSQRYYREKLGLKCHVLPNLVHWKEAEVQGRNPRYVTFINPLETKGVYVFARIARELARRRPDIPILVTQGRSRTDALNNAALGLVPHLRGQFPVAPTCDGRNITTMPFTPDPRNFYPAVYANTKLLLMPSLWLESFGLVAAEAMLNGIPVLASNRGALPDTIRDAGFLFDIPARYTSETCELPTAEEVEPWVETITRLWDHPAEYERCSSAARERAQAWHPDRLAPLYREFFGNLVNQPASSMASLSQRA